MTLTARPGLAILFVLLAALALSLSGPPAQAQDGSVSDQDEEPDVSYVTVVVDRTPEPSVAQFTVTWNDAHEGKCSTQYNAYLVDYFVDTEDVHLGSATSDDVQIVKTVDSSGMDGGLGYAVNMVCGDYRDTDDYRYVSRIRLLGGLPSGTYSSEPALIGLVVDSGSLEPAFHQYKFSYVVDDVPASRERITVTATAKDGLYSIVFVEGHVRWTGQGCGANGCQFNYDNESREELNTLEDVDADTPGFQLDLEEGQTDFSIHVHPLVDGGNVYQFSVTSTVTVQNSPATGQPTISGTAQVGETLTAETDGIEDADGLTNVSFSYQWIRSDGRTDTNIAGQTTSTYTLVSADEGQTIKARVSFTDDANNPETLTSLATAAVEPQANTPATGAPTISGTAQVGETLTAETDGIADADGLSKVVFTYQWLSSRDAEIQGATDSTYTLAATDEGKTIKVQVSFTDDANNPETLTSLATAAVEAKANSPARGAPTISGTAQVGETLTASILGIADDDGLPAADQFGYQWIANDGTTDADIASATDSTYTLVDDDAGKTVKVKVSFTDDKNNQETLTSAPTAAVAARPNSPATGQPTISGTAQVGETLTAETLDIVDADGLSTAAYSYQWVRNDGTTDTEIQGATDPTYTLVDDDARKAVKVKVSFTDDQNNQETLTSEATATVAAAPTPLTAWSENEPEEHSGTDAFTFRIAFSEAISTSYRTLRDQSLEATNGSVTRAKRVNGQSDLWEVTVQPDSAADVTVVLPVTNDCSAQGAVCTSDGKMLSNRLELTVAGPQDSGQNSPAEGLPTISGTVQVGETLSSSISGIVDADGLIHAVYSYQWVRNDGATDSDITGATDTAYTLVAADAGRTIKVRVLFTDDAENEEALTSAPTAAVEPQANSPATGAPTISGTAQVGETLTASILGITDADGLPAESEFAYQWVRNDGTTDTDIQGATNDSYTLVADDQGKTIKVKVSFTDDAENEETLTSLATTAVEPQANTPATGAPTISGTAQVGETLTAEINGIADADGLSKVVFTYQWLSSRDAEIQGATDSTYTLAATDEGKTIKVQVSFTDDAENEETLTSLATAAVEPQANSLATGAPSISGTAQVSETLTAETLDIVDVDGLVRVAYSYQWLADEVEIAGATNINYTLVDDDVGKTIKLQVSFTDDRDFEETLTSAPTAAVAAKPNSPAKGAPTISGTPQVGKTLTADISGIADADGLTNVSFSYQWIGNDVEMTGATGSTYTLVADDEGKAVKVRVSFTDDKSHQETLTSEVTAAVATAADDSSIWSATLTVGSSAGFHGYWEDWIGSLAPDGFNIDGSDYTVMSLGRYGDLMFAFVLDQALPGDFTLQVGDTTFRSEEAEITTSSSSYSYQWQNKIPDLSDGDIVEVSLTLAESPAAGPSARTTKKGLTDGYVRAGPSLPPDRGSPVHGGGEPVAAGAPSFPFRPLRGCRTVWTLL